MDGLLPLLDVDLARIVAVEGLKRLLEPRGLQKELEVVLAAVLQEGDHLVVRLHGLNDFGDLQGAGEIFIDEVETFSCGI